MLRIISGEFNRRVIRTIESKDMRPTTDRVRQSLFDFLFHRIDFEGISSLDLYAGSGILGFETLSRGAESVTFVESNIQVTKAIEANCKMLKVESRAILLTMDALQFLDKNDRTFDLIFADPPYRYEYHTQLINLLISKNLLKPDGVFVLEHHATANFSTSPLFCLRKEFGTTVISFFSVNKSIFE
ncbi:MAG: 16S rRNA (guanine(966)-N(2))-methyltransferase RsmD [Chloroherpetonaceae bacterium]|nr:16S rRNA (guanine(966)-N(2))-methyltransferase RsmD [Chloroherpetonaceae bacterium]